jgi:xanthine dehydrogenase accessory factor
MTYSHDLDLKLVEAALKRGDAGWVGLIGSDSKRARFDRRLAKVGLDPARLVCPIGIPGIGGKHPKEIAVAVAAQLLIEAELVAVPA